MLLAFFPQRQPLMNPEPVLFINNHQRQTVKLYMLLENSVGADHHLHLPAGNGFLLGNTRFAFLLTGKPTHLNPKGFKPGRKVAGMLFGKQFRRRHQRHLFAIRNGA